MTPGLSRRPLRGLPSEDRFPKGASPSLREAREPAAVSLKCPAPRCSDTQQTPHTFVGWVNKWICRSWYDWLKWPSTHLRVTNSSSISPQQQHGPDLTLHWKWPKRRLPSHPGRDPIPDFPSLGKNSQHWQLGLGNSREHFSGPMLAISHLHFGKVTFLPRGPRGGRAIIHHQIMKSSRTFPRRQREDSTVLTTRLARPPVRSQLSIKCLEQTGGDRGAIGGQWMSSPSSLIISICSHLLSGS